MSQKHPLGVEKVTTLVPFIFESNPWGPPQPIPVIQPVGVLITPQQSYLKTFLIPYIR